MDDRLTRVLKVVAVALVVAFVGWAVYDRFFGSVAPGDMAYHAGNQAFEDGNYPRAAEAYRAALRENPDHVCALRGLARSLHLAGRHDEALVRYDQAIARTPQAPQDEGERAALAATMPTVASFWTPWAGTRRRWPTTPRRCGSIPRSPRARIG
jgi:tetratricopeptide (TPR) repeat protein